VKKELEDQLVARFPEFFVGVGLSPRESNMCFGCSCGDGWYPIIYDTCELLEFIKAPLVWTQIKEKFGGLRMYYHFTEDDFPLLMRNAVDAIINAAEEKASRTCESCGDFHTAYIRCTFGWYRCECDECYTKRTAKPTGG
jgi:hypothetical protein